MLDPYWASVFALAAVNVLYGLGLYVTMLSGQISAAHAALGGIAGFGSGYLSMHEVLPSGVSMVAAVLGATVCGMLIAWPVMRLRGLFLAIATLGFSSAVAVVIVNIPALGGPAGMAGIPLVVTPTIILTALAVVLVWFLLFDSSLTALSFRAVRDNELAAAASGISVRRVRITAFGIGAFISATAGALNAHYSGVVTTNDFSFGVIAQQITFVGLGGFDVFLGPVIGAGFFSFLPEVLRFTAEDRLIIFAALTILVVTLRPQGLVSRRFVRRFTGLRSRRARARRGMRRRPPTSAERRRD